MSRSTSVLAASWLVGALLLSPGGVGAQPRGAQSTQTADQARSAFERGVAAVDAGRYAAAVSAFEESYRLRPVFRVLYNLARVHESAGQLRQARAIYERYLREGGASVPADRAREVRGTLARLEREIPRVTVRSVPDDARVEVDGRVEQPTGGVLALDPGRHVFVVAAEGYGESRREMQLASGARENLTVELVVEERARDGQGVQSGSVFSRWWFWTAVGVVAVGGTVLALGLAGTFTQTEPLLPGTAYDVAAIRWR